MALLTFKFYKKLVVLRLKFLHITDILLNKLAKFYPIKTVPITLKIINRAGLKQKRKDYLFKTQDSLKFANAQCQTTRGKISCLTSINF